MEAKKLTVNRLIEKTKSEKFEDQSSLDYNDKKIELCSSGIDLYDLSNYLQEKYNF